MGHARALLGVEGSEAIRKLATRAVREQLSVRALEALVRALNKPAGKAKPAEGNASTRELVNRLQRRLGARCRVVQKSISTGRLEIDYATLVELDAILARIGA
jgi:ParB family chromosome partitioning protein